MISIRSAISRRIIGGRGTPNIAAAFLQANIPFPSLTSSDKTTTNNNMSSASIRHLSSPVSPAYKRHILKNSQSTKGEKPAITTHGSGIQLPSRDVARDMGMAFSEMENEPLLVIAEMGNHKARTEVLRRHIMAVESIRYNEAGKIMDEIAAKNRENMTIYVLPYVLGIVCAGVLGVGAIPMVFEIDLALWFNHHYVTMEIPPPSDLDTALETGAWTWNWMEPIIGTASFTLLALQFGRQQMLNLGLKPYTQWIISRRSKFLYKAYPQYDETMIHSFVESDPMIN